MATPKILVVGSLNGQFESALKKVSSLHAKNSFSLAIFTGDVFSSETDDNTITSLLNGEFAFPLPSYFTVGSHALPERIASKLEADEDICHNLHFLGKRSTTKTLDGIRIVSLGGLLDTNIVGGQSKEQHLPYHTPDDAKSLRGANKADILLTSMWPSNVCKGSKTVLDPTDQGSILSSMNIADLCAALRPRYHISASPNPFFYEREPFIHPSVSDSDAVSVTRFISMAPFGNDAKAKALYAFSLNKSDKSLPIVATASPFATHEKRKSRIEDSYSRFESHQDGHHHGRRNKRQRAPPPGPDRCYFCLSNPNMSAHMCCSIGDEAYVTTAKGPLPTSTTFSEQGLNFPGHLLIIPLPHEPTIADMGAPSDPGSVAARTYKEMERFRDAIQSMISSKSSHKLGVVTWEISRGKNIHLIWQVIAIPASLIQQGLAEAAFKVEAERLSYPALTTKNLALEDYTSLGDFFRVWLWADNGEDKIKGTSLVMPLPSDLRFDLQFGRHVLAKLLRLEDRFSWQKCAQSEEEEVKDVEAFREAFKDWDFTLHD